MSKKATSLVLQMGEIQFRGHTIPHVWYQRLVKRGKFGRSKTVVERPYLAAIVVLSDICYWYRPRYVMDEETNQIMAIERRFFADKLQRSYKQLSEQFGLGKEQARLAVKWLEAQGYVTLEFRNITTKGGMVLSNVLFIAPIPEAIKKLNDSACLEPKTPRLEPKTPRRRLKGTYTESTTEITTETTTHDTPPPSTADGDAPAGQEGPTPGRKLEYLSFPGFSVVEITGVHVVEVYPEPTDQKLTCPDCEHRQVWPPSENRRRKPAALICEECGAFFKVVGYKVSGKNFTYQLPAARRGGKMKVTVPKAKGRFRVFGCSLRQAKELAELWTSAGEKEVVSILDWMHRDVECGDDEVPHILLQSARTRRARRAAKNVPEPVIVRADDDTDFVSGFPDDFFDE